MINTIKAEYSRRMLTESLFRINKVLDIMNEESIWFQHNEYTNSVANLILHLSGNINQYINSTIGNEKDSRDRSLEFSSVKTHNIDELRTLIKNVITNSIEVINNSSLEGLSKIYKVQCFNESGLSIIIHVIEHTSYHTGQITLLCKQLHPMDTKYYDNMDLNQTNQ